MLAKIMKILEQHRIMTVATIRPDGWPQATTVGYVSDGMLQYFLISRSGQKYKNIVNGDRVSIAIASDNSVPSHIEGLSMAARASELRDDPYRADMFKKLCARHPKHFDHGDVDWKSAALMRASPVDISLVDFSKESGHTDTATVGAEQMLEFGAARPADWGPGPSSR